DAVELQTRRGYGARVRAAQRLLVRGAAAALRLPAVEGTQSAGRYAHGRRRRQLEYERVQGPAGESVLRLRDAREQQPRTSDVAQHRYTGGSFQQTGVAALGAVRAA